MCNTPFKLSFEIHGGRTWLAELHKQLPSFEWGFGGGVLFIWGEEHRRHLQGSEVTSEYNGEESLQIRAAHRESTFVVA
jgi:hypothetical protein